MLEKGGKGEWDECDIYINSKHLSQPAFEGVDDMMLSDIGDYAVIRC